MESTFYKFKLDLEPNVIDMIYDILRMSTIQLVTQIMFYMNNSALSLFSETFIKTFIFINMSILFYYLVVRKIFSFVSDDYLNVNSKPYAHTPPMKPQSLPVDIPIPEPKTKTDKIASNTLSSPPPDPSNNTII